MGGSSKIKKIFRDFMLKFCVANSFIYFKCKKILVLCSRDECVKNTILVLHTHEATSPGNPGLPQNKKKSK